MKDEKTKASIIILHGWGLKGSVYKELAVMLQKSGHKAYILDFPGFGTEPLVNNHMVLDDYVAFLKKFIEKNKLKKPILVGHSFGGRVAIKYAWKYPEDTTSLILTGVPLIRHTTLKKKIAYICAVVGGKTLKMLPKETRAFMRKVLYASIGEWDYYKAGPLQQVFKNIIGEGLTFYAKDIHVPTLLVWGKNDKIVPASDIEKIKKYIPQATSVIVEGEDHKLPYLNPRLFFDAIKSSL